MRKLSITVIVTSLLIGLYSFYIGMQVMDAEAHVKSLESIIMEERVNTNEEMQYHLDGIQGSSGAAQINTWLINGLTLINLITAIYFLYKESKKKSV